MRSHWRFIWRVILGYALAIPIACVGLVLCVGIITAPIGIPLVFFAGWICKRLAWDPLVRHWVEQAPVTNRHRGDPPEEVEDLSWLN